MGFSTRHTPHHTRISAAALQTTSTMLLLRMYRIRAMRTSFCSLLDLKREIHALLEANKSICTITHSTGRSRVDLSSFHNTEKGSIIV
mmetsp:Transcript_16124/g.24303  ORF Transcript_16124/g.24303 Transcript_16124/m.24303 type:complete len:88 (+) Transcript_16124:130-393(+)